MTVADGREAKNLHPATFLGRQIQTARMMVSRPATCAIMRCVCSNFTPPTSLRNLVPGAEGGGPVGNRKPGVIAGDQCTSNNQKKGPAGEHDGKAMKAAIVGCSDGFQSSAPCVGKAFDLS